MKATLSSGNNNALHCFVSSLTFSCLGLSSVSFWNLNDSTETTASIFYSVQKAVPLPLLRVQSRAFLSEEHTVVKECICVNVCPYTHR